MIRAEAEEVFIAAILSGEKKVAIKMEQGEAKVFRVLIGRTLKEMESKNRALWLKARGYGVTYKDPYLLIQLLDSNRFEMMSVAEDGSMSPIINMKKVESEIEKSSESKNYVDEAEND